MSKLFILSFTILLFASPYKQLVGQQSYNFKKISLKRTTTVNPRLINNDWLFELQNLDEPFEGNESYKGYLQKQKDLVHAKYNSKDFVRTDNQVYNYYTVDTPIVNIGFEGNRYSASVPNDNTMAVSNDGIVVSAINTNIIFYDTKTDSLLKTISLNAFSDTLATVSTHQYDPKAIYDYQNDRFIVVFLAGAGTSPTSDIIVAFSSSSDPMDEWSLYSLSGNPLGDTSWSDYPAIALSNDELFITVNLLKTGNGNWQTSFKQSVIWQIDKNDGFQGDSIQVGLYSGIGTNGVPVRNIHPVRGGNKFYGPDLYFLSERNFDLKNDTFFLIHTNNNLSVVNPILTIDAIRSDMPYGMPPNAKQTNGRFLATNDSRVLGAFYQNGSIQFVGNSVDTLTGHSSFYHGIFNPKNVKEKIHLNVLTDTLLEFGYPNISYCGSNSESLHSIITYNYSCSTVYPGMGAMFYEGRNYKGESLYSKPIVLKKGSSPIRVLLSTQRWGDYSGSQPRYNRVGEVWASGTFGRVVGSTQAYGTWIASLLNSVSDIPVIPQGENIVSSVYPNPNVDFDKITIDFVLPYSEEIQIQIFDVSGKQVSNIYQGKAEKGRNLLSISTHPLSSGIYFLVIKNNQSVLKTHKISVL